MSHSNNSPGIQKSAHLVDPLGKGLTQMEYNRLNNQISTAREFAIDCEKTDFHDHFSQLLPFLTPSKPLRIMNRPQADVAELADAQVSEACDGDIVEVQVLSSAPCFWKRAANAARFFSSID
jgi:hypothetical protein